MAMAMFPGFGHGTSFEAGRSFLCLGIGISFEAGRSILCLGIGISFEAGRSNESYKPTGLVQSSNAPARSSLTSTASGDIALVPEVLAAGGFGGVEHDDVGCSHVGKGK